MEKRILSNPEEIVENNKWFKLSPLRWSKFRRQSVLTSHYAGVQESQKINPGKKTLKISPIFSCWRKSWGVDMTCCGLL